MGDEAALIFVQDLFFLFPMWENLDVNLFMSCKERSAREATVCRSVCLSGAYNRNLPSCPPFLSRNRDIVINFQFIISRRDIFRDLRRNFHHVSNIPTQGVTSWTFLFSLRGFFFILPLGATLLLMSPFSDGEKKLNGDVENLNKVMSVLIKTQSTLQLYTGKNEKRVKQRRSEKFLSEIY